MAEFPHCDSLVLHAPGACVYCDKYPEKQDERIRNTTAFTGEEAERFGLPCPATVRRSLEVINLWPGNRPVSEDPNADQASA